MDAAETGDRDGGRAILADTPDGADAAESAVDAIADGPDEAESSTDALPDGSVESAKTTDGGEQPGDAEDATDAGVDADGGEVVDVTVAGDGDVTAAGDGDVTDTGTPMHCSRSHPFGVPTLVPSVNTDSGTVESARFSPDELTVYMGMLHGLYLETFVATRRDRANPFEAPQPVSGFNIGGVTDFATVTADGLALYFESNRSGRYALYASERTSVTVDFPTPVWMDALNTGAEGNPYVLPDGSALYFHTYRAGNFDIYRAARGTHGFDSAAPIDLDSQLDEADPVVSADDLTLYYARPGNGTAPVWMATRQSRLDAFSNPVPLTELSGPLTVRIPEWISPDDCRLYIQEQDSLGGVFIYVAQRPPDDAP
jgi:hypothetical protein